MRTEDVSQDRRTWLNLLQLANIHVILVTLETFHEDMSWLKTMALSNMAFMLVTFEVSHAPMSSSNSPQQKNMAFMFLTEDVSHNSFGRSSTRRSAVSIAAGVRQYAGSIATGPGRLIPRRAALGKPVFCEASTHSNL